MITDQNYQNKYFKYKHKYLMLKTRLGLIKKQYGGDIINFTTKEYVNYIFGRLGISQNLKTGELVGFTNTIFMENLSSLTPKLEPSDFPATVKITDLDEEQNKKIIIQLTNKLLLFLIETNLAGFEFIYKNVLTFARLNNILSNQQYSPNSMFIDLSLSKLNNLLLSDESISNIHEIYHRYCGDCGLPRFRDIQPVEKNQPLRGIFGVLRNATNNKITVGISVGSVHEKKFLTLYDYNINIDPFLDLNNISKQYETNIVTQTSSQILVKNGNKKIYFIKGYFPLHLNENKIQREIIELLVSLPENIELIINNRMCHTCFPSFVYIIKKRKNTKYVNDPESDRPSQGILDICDIPIKI